MKQIFFLMALTGLIQISCTKKDTVSPVSVSLNGKWRMIMVKENTSGLTTTKPSLIQGNVDITFTSLSNSGGTFFGNTPSNDILQNNYSTGTNQSLNIPVLNMTKISETSWGEEFVRNIRSSQEYSFESDGKLNIRTPAKTLTFQKL